MTNPSTYKFIQYKVEKKRIYNDDELIMKFLPSSEINFVVLIASLGELLKLRNLFHEMGEIS